MTTPLLDQLANALTLALREHVGRVEVKTVMQAALDAYAEAERERFVQFAADRQYISAETRELIRLDSLAIDAACGF